MAALFRSFLALLLPALVTGIEQGAGACWLEGADCGLEPEEQVVVLLQLGHEARPVAELLAGAQHLGSEAKAAAAGSQALALTVGLSAGLVLAGFLSVRWSGDEPDAKLADEAAAEPARPAEASKAAAPAPEPEQPALSLVLFYVLGHSLAASTLTIMNKVAMKAFHPPTPGVGPAEAGGPKGYVWTLVVLQFAFAGLAARGAGLLGLVKCEPLEFRRALAFFPAAAMFMITIVAGNAVMNFSNVNTFLVLRALVPLPCNISEVLVYKDPSPPLVSGIALLVTVGGAVSYALAVGGIELRSVAWAVIFLITMPIDGLLIKQSISSSKLSPWGLVYYNNILALLPALVFTGLFELQSFAAVGDAFRAAIAPGARVAVPLCCALGIAISYFQLNTRYYISATAFMVLGVVNKFLTVLVNNVFLEHQGAMALFCVLASLAGAVLWQQTVKWEAVKVRHGAAPWERSLGLPFCVTCASLVWAAYIQYTQQDAVAAGHA